MPTLREHFHQKHLSVVHEEPIQFITSQNFHNYWRNTKMCWKVPSWTCFHVSLALLSSGRFLGPLYMIFGILKYWGRSKIMSCFPAWQDDKLEPNFKYLIYRLCYFSYLLVTFILALEPGFFRYLTNWGYTLLLVQSWVVLLMLTVSTIGRRYVRNRHWQFYVLKLHPFYWCLNTCSNSTGFVITITYWILVAMYGKALDYAVEGMDLFVHAFNSLVIILDICIVEHPVQVMHFVYPLIFGVAYSIYSVIYHFYDTSRGGSGYVYGVLDWARPHVAAPLVLVLLLFVVILHVLTYGMFRLRQRIYKKLTGHKTVEADDYEDSRYTTYT